MRGHSDILGRGTSMVDCNLERKAQICVNRPTNSGKNWTYESLMNGYRDNSNIFFTQFATYPNVGAITRSTPNTETEQHPPQ